MAKGNRRKSSFIAFRAESRIREKLKAMSMQRGLGGNMSEMPRILVDEAPDPTQSEIYAGAIRFIEEAE